MSTDTRGIFALIDVADIALSDEWVNLADVWAFSSPSTSENTGYFGGGFGSAVSSSFDKLSYSSDTTAAAPSAKLTSARYYLTATGSSIAGYFGGGSTPGPSRVSTMDKLTYSTDTISYVPTTNLSSPLDNSSATGNKEVGYFGGGRPSSPGAVSKIDKLIYSIDTTAAAPSTNLSGARYGLAAVGGSKAGYFAGGIDASFATLSTTDKLSYSSDTIAALPSIPGGTLTPSRYQLAATGSPSVGYFGGGNPLSLEVNSVSYTFDSVLPAGFASNLSSARYGLAATGNSTHGYFGGGSTPSGRVSTMDKITYGSETTAAVPSANLSSARSVLAASSARANALPTEIQKASVRFSDETQSINTGHFGGGVTNSFGGTTLSTMEKFSYLTETTEASPSANLSVARYGLAATGNSTAGYFGGGFSFPTNFSTMDKLTYSLNTMAVAPGANLTSARNRPGATGSTTAGYFGGGIAPVGILSTMDKVTYSTDTTAATPSANLSAARGRLAAVGNSIHGYFGGGLNPPLTPQTVTTIDKLTYSTDTRTSILSVLTNGRHTYAAAGNSIAGYFGGGIASPFPVSTFDKLTYSSETVELLPFTCRLSAARSYLAATGNITTGYFGGGAPAPGAYTSMDRVTYSTDTCLAIPGSNAYLNVPRQELAAASARANELPQPPAATPTPQTSVVMEITPNTGYFGGGIGGASTIDKLTYTTDTTVRLSTSNLPTLRTELCAVGSVTIGYFGGGFLPDTSFDKLSYSTDTAEFAPGVNLAAPRNGLAAVGSETIGYFAGGITPSSTTPSGLVTRVERLFYSSDTVSSVPTVNISGPARYALAATGNSTSGYFGGGGGNAFFPGTPTSIMNRLSYATDIVLTTPSLVLQTTNLAATGNATQGYFGGGLVPGPSTTGVINKITYGTDVRTNIPALGISRTQLAATGNSTQGYFGGGFDNISTIYSRVDKVTYSSDTTALAFNASLSSGRRFLAATSCRANALPFAFNVNIPNNV